MSGRICAVPPEFARTRAHSARTFILCLCNGRPPSTPTAFSAEAPGLRSSAACCGFFSHHRSLKAACRITSFPSSLLQRYFTTVIRVCQQLFSRTDKRQSQNWLRWSYQDISTKPPLHQDCSPTPYRPPRSY